MTFLVKIGLWLIGLWGNPVVQEIVHKTVSDLINVGQDVLTLAINAVKEAAENDDLDSGAKFEFVVNKLLAAFPGLGKSLANRIVENAYGAWKGK